MVHRAVMLNILSLIIGVVALLVGILAFFPFLGALYWLIVPLALLGLLLGLLSRAKSGRNLNMVVVIVGIFRLWLGGGLF